MIQTKEDELLSEINDNAQQLKNMIQGLVEGRKKLKSSHSDELEDYEKKMVNFFWQCRDLLSTATMARMAGWSRQTLYSKWEKYGYVVDDQTQSK
jgi:DNA-binding NtrC family response regulator